jgi:hypothetical protein
MFECGEGGLQQVLGGVGGRRDCLHAVGTLGSGGQTKLKPESDPDPSIEKLVREKTGKGYIEKNVGLGAAKAAKGRAARSRRLQRS